jgi:hypothetical protein
MSKKTEDKFVTVNTDTDNEQKLWTQNSVPAGVIEGTIGMSLTEVFKSFGALKGDYGESKTMKSYGVKNTKATIKIAVDELHNVWQVTSEMNDATLAPRHRFAKYRVLQFLQSVERLQDEIKSARYKSSPVLVKGLQLCTEVVSDIGTVMAEKDNVLALKELKAMRTFIINNRGGEGFAKV